ncbi:MAG: hypothetical protein PVG97_09270, partial [Syntrophobacterales bacterium]
MKISHNIHRERLLFVIIFLLFLIVVSDMDAAIKNHDENGVNRLIVIYKFKMEGGSDSLRSLESLLPEVLRAYFLGLGWHATIETELG